ncbi:MAG: ATPase [Lachnospiraceae bacterium]|nr:ATPase [Lachnospiraceae bacterium]
MSSRIEQIIDEIEEYIEDCKPQVLSSGSRIIVNKDEILELIAELRQKTPEEIRRYQKIISNQEAILADARTKADEILAQAQIQTNELVSEHEIMQQAYAQANEVVMASTQQAQEILNQATNDANAIRESAMAYTDDMLRNLETVIKSAINENNKRASQLDHSLQEYLDVIVSNRAEINPVPAEPQPESAPAKNAEEKAEPQTETSAE